MLALSDRHAEALTLLNKIRREKKHPVPRRMAFAYSKTIRRDSRLLAPTPASPAFFAQSVCPFTAPECEVESWLRKRRFEWGCHLTFESRANCFIRVLKPACSRTTAS